MAYIFVLAVEAGHSVRCALGACRSPIERAIELLEQRSAPAVLAYASIGTMRQAIVCKLALRESLSRWPAQGTWIRVPVADGPEFRERVRATLNRYERAGVPVELHHVDMAEYFASRKRASLAVRRRFTASKGALKWREDH